MIRLLWPWMLATNQLSSTVIKSLLAQHCCEQEMCSVNTGLDIPYLRKQNRIITDNSATFLVPMMSPAFISDMKCDSASCLLACHHQYELKQPALICRYTRDKTLHLYEWIAMDLWGQTQNHCYLHLLHKSWWRWVHNTHQHGWLETMEQVKFKPSQV